MTKDKSPHSAVRCRAVFKSFGVGPTRTDVLKGADLDAGPGELTFVVGPSGCGKTTLLSIVAGILTPDHGTVDILGTSLTSLTGSGCSNFRSKNIGFILQQFNLLPALDVIENVAIPLLILGQTKRQIYDRARDSLELVGMNEHWRKYPRELSVGQQQRVAIARAIVHRPRLILCDEPTSALDAETGAMVIEQVRDCALSNKCAVLIVTHDLRITRPGDRIWEVQDGHIRAFENSQQGQAA
jgi:putative ABC transport system ATP-binding protein